MQLPSCSENLFHQHYAGASDMPIGKAGKGPGASFGFLFRAARRGGQRRRHYRSAKTQCQVPGTGKWFKGPLRDTPSPGELARPNPLAVLLHAAFTCLFCGLERGELDISDRPACLWAMLVSSCPLGPEPFPVPANPLRRTETWLDRPNIARLCSRGIG